MNRMFQSLFLRREHEKFLHISLQRLFLRQKLLIFLIRQVGRLIAFSIYRLRFFIITTLSIFDLKSSGFDCAANNDSFFANNSFAEFSMT